jgi:hypothetical protein
MDVNCNCNSIDLLAVLICVKVVMFISGPGAS